MTARGAKESIPVTVVGGYLGAGKTTLVNRILTGDHGRRIAVIVNDFGDVAVDDALLEPASGGIRALANGCVCCAAVDGLGAAMAELRTLDPRPEHVLIEVSGVGDPWKVAQWGRSPGYELDGVLVVVDPAAIREWAQDPYVGATVLGQIAAADLLLMSHADDTPASEFSEVEHWIRSRGEAPVLASGDAALEVLLGLPRRSGRASGAHAAHASRAVRPRPTSRDELRRWLRDAPDPVVRVKGVVPCDEGLVVAQRVGGRTEVRPARAATEPRLVVIVAAPTVSDRVSRWVDQISAGAPVALPPRPPASSPSPDR